MASKNNILLTGASGMVGSHLLQKLVDGGYNIVCLCSWKHLGKPENILSCNDLSNVKIITHDLNAPLTVDVKKQIGNIDIILNIASDSHVDRSITEPVSFIQNNVNLAINMLEFAREIKPKLFLQFSTDEVYGVAEDNFNHKEWASIVPSNPYSASKACQEAIAISYWRTYGVPVVITNTMNVFSERQDWEKFIPLVVKKIKNQETVFIHSYPNKQKAGSRYYIHADDVANAVIHIMRIEPQIYPKNGLPSRYNIVGEKEVDNLELAKAISNVLDKELNYELVDFHSSRPGHDTRYALDGTLLRSTGWDVENSFDDKLKEVVLKLWQKL